VPGATVATTAPVLAALLSGPEIPGTVVIGLSLANEGLASTGSEAAARQLADGFLHGLHELAAGAERAGASVVLGGVYPNDDLDLTQTRELRRTHARMASWRWPLINFLERTEAGAGQSPLAHWQPRMRADAWHPNEEGHAAMFDAINLRLFLQPGCGHGRPPLLPPPPPTFPPLQPHLELKPHPPGTPPRSPPRPPTSPSPSPPEAPPAGPTLLAARARARVEYGAAALVRASLRALMVGAALVVALYMFWACSECLSNAAIPTLTAAGARAGPSPRSRRHVPLSAIEPDVDNEGSSTYTTS